MSEVAKNVETPVAIPATETPVVAEPIVEAPKAVEPVTDAPATEAVATEESAVEEAKPAEEVKPVEEGVLGYKGTGLVKGLFFQKKFFWFGTEPVESKTLSSYLRGEKPEVGNHNVAWAAHTGKGLLFFSKKEADKATPASIINLAEVSEVTTEGHNVFLINESGHKHQFEAKSTSERDNWVAQLKAKSAEAKEAAPAIAEHETYKSTLEKLKPTVVAVTPKKSTEVKKEVAEAKEEKKEEAAEAKEEKKEEKLEVKDEKKTARKSRSASRKRNSIFGNIGFGKKEEKVEAPKEDTTAVAPAVEATSETAATEPAAVEATPATVEATSPTVEEAATEAKAVDAKPASKKRNSVFGTLKSYVSEPKTKKAEAPVVPAKDVVEPEPVSETAPVIPAVESTEPLATSVASPATVPTEVTPITNGETKAAETPVTKADKRKSSIPWLSSKKDKATTSDEEGEKPKSPFARIRATVKGKSTPKTDKPAETVAEPATETKSEDPVVSEPVPAVTSTPAVTASA